MSKIIDTSEPKKATGFRYKKLLIVGVPALVLLLGGGFFLFKNQITPDSNNKKSAVETAISRYDEASQLAATKSVSESNKLYDDRVAKTSDNKEKVLLLLDKASIAYNAGDFDSSLQTAFDANKLQSSTGTLTMIAQSYEAKGDKANAVEYYKKALAALPKSEVTNRQEVSLKSKIQELSQ